MQRNLKRIVLVAAMSLVGLFWASPAFAYGPNAPVIGASPSVLSPGASFTVTGANYQPGETVTLVLFSTPVTLGTSGPTDATGSFSMGVTLPADAAIGGHTIVGTGNSIGDSASTGITVVSSSASAGTATGTGIGGTSGSPTIAGASGAAPTTPATGSLAFTGSDIAATAGVGAIAIALGGMLVMAGRRRRVTSNHSS